LRGEHNTWYNFLSAKNTSVNVHFEHSDFRNPYRLVHGSKMSRLGMTVRTNLTGQIVKVGMNATAGFQRVLVQTESERRWMDRRTGSIQIENVKLTLREQKMGNLGHGMALTINTGRWEVKVWSKRYPNPAANPGKALLNIAIGAQYDADHDEVAPHGLVGQSYDGDSVAVDGAMDDYTGKEMTTKAMAEGAIEGTADQYRMADSFATEYMYSRFDALHAKPRDLTKLTGRKRAAKVAGGGPNFYQINALPDVE